MDFIENMLYQNVKKCSEGLHFLRKIWRVSIGLALIFCFIEYSIAGIAQRNKDQTTDETCPHFRIKYHTDTGDQTEEETEYRYYWKQWSGKT